MLQRIYFLLLVALSVVSVIGQQGFCYAKDGSKEQIKHYATKTPYEVARGTDKTKFTMPKCKAVKFWIMVRHGARNPEPKKVEFLSGYDKFRDSILENFSNNRDRTSNQLCNEDLELLKLWRFDTNMTSYAKYLTAQGWNELKNLAINYQKTFPNVIGSEYKRDKFRFVYSNTQRTQASYKAFVEGLFGPGADTFVNASDELNYSNLLRPYEGCAASEYSKMKSEDANSEYIKFRDTKIFRRTAQELSSRLGFKDVLTPQQIEIMFDMCRYHQTWNNEEKSAWCVAFTPEHVNVLEYHEDLRIYIKASYGSPSNSKIMCAAVNDLVKFLLSNVSPQVSGYFSHSSAVQLFLTALGYGKDDTPLRADNYHEMKNRKFKTSVLSPLASNLAVVKYECEDDPERFKVKFFLNESPITFDWCNDDGLCSLSEMQTAYKEFLGADCEKKSFCDISAITSKDEVNKTLELLKEGDEKIQLSNRYKNVTLVLGNTGSGKSTFVQWFAGDDSKLIATEVTADSGDFFIVDKDNRINDGIDSKTIFPELFVKNETNDAIYDCPGFSDTRSTSIDIANTYFIKKLTDHADNLKILLLINHSTLKKGVDRLDFMKLMKHVTEFVKDVKKYESSIAIVVSKVFDFRVVKGVPEITPDDVVTRKIADFLKQAQSALIDKRTNSEVSMNDKKVNEDTLKVLDILLTNKDARIGLFRKPLEAGPLSANEELKKGKKLIEQMWRELKYTATSDDDFGFTISEKSLNDINNLVDQLLIDVEKDLNHVVETLTNTYQKSVKIVQNNLENIDKTSSEIDKYFSKRFNAIITGSKIMSNLMKNIENVSNITKIAVEIEKMLKDAEFIILTDNINHLKTRGEYLNFFEVVSNKKLSTKSWEKLFRPLEQLLNDSKSSIEVSIKDKVENIRNGINGHFNTIMDDIASDYLIKIGKIDVQDSINQVERLKTELSEIIRDLERSNAQNLSNYLNNTIRYHKVDSAEINGNLSQITRLSQKFAFLDELGLVGSSSWSSDWISKARDTQNRISDSVSWIRFLKHLYNSYSTYDSIKTKPTQDVTVENFPQFIKDLSSLNIEGYDENFQFTADRLTSLNKLLNSISVDISCSDNGEMYVKGDFIRFSDFTSPIGKFNPSCNGQTLKTLNIFATNTLFIDGNFDAVGAKLRLILVAPKWVWVDRHKISLNGADGEASQSGGNAGNFMGIGSEFLNHQLFVSANGGRGGKGGGQGGKKGMIQIWNLLQKRGLTNINSYDGAGNGDSSTQSEKRVKSIIYSWVCDDYKTVNESLTHGYNKHLMTKFFKELDNKLGEASIYQ